MSRAHDIQPTKDWRCSEDECPSFDGKRCLVLGHRPSEFCEPKLKLVRLGLKKKRKRISALEVVLGDLLDVEPCDLDHHGNCQPHNYFGEGECRNARGLKLLLKKKDA